MLLNPSYLVSFQFQFNLQLGTGTWNLCHVLVANIVQVILGKGKDTMAGNWPLNTGSNIFSVRLFPLYII
jgi:hypothetical protein